MRTHRSPLAHIDIFDLSQLAGVGHGFREDSALPHFLTLVCIVTHLWAKTSLPDNLEICNRLAPHRAYIGQFHSITYDMISFRRLPRWQCPVANHCLASKTSRFQGGRGEISSLRS